MKKGHIYILTNKPYGVLYVGVTSNITKRLYQHKNGLFAHAFTSKYNLNRLVYYYEFCEIRDAILYEKKIKNWKREWKIKLITDFNPTWKDLSKGHE